MNAMTLPSQSLAGVGMAMFPMTMTASPMRAGNLDRARSSARAGVRELTGEEMSAAGAGVDAALVTYTTGATTAAGVGLMFGLPGAGAALFAFTVGFAVGSAYNAVAKYMQ